MDEDEIANQQYEEQLEDQTIVGEDAREDLTDGAFAPYTREKQDLQALFRHIIDRWDVTKVANLDPKTELGMSNISFRGAKNIALIANFLGEREVWEFFSRQAQQVIAGPSLSKNGHLLDVFITQKKMMQRTKGILSDRPDRPEGKEKWTLFRKKKRRS